MKHAHHIIPRHIDTPENIARVSVEEHAELHFALYLEHGKYEDYLAAMALSGQITHAEAANENRRNYMTNRTITEASSCVCLKGRSVGSRTTQCQKKIKNGDEKLSVARTIPYGKKHSSEIRKKCSEGAKKQWERKLVWVNDGKINRRVEVHNPFRVCQKNHK